MPERLRDTAERVKEALPAPVRAVGSIVRQTLDDFLEDGGPRLAAAIAYYLLIALAPLLILAVTGATVLLERAEVREAILELADNLLGYEGVVAIDQVLSGVMRQRLGGGATAVSIGIALFGASAAFSQIQAALNIAWGVRPRPEGFKEFLRRRSFAFLLIIIIGILLLLLLTFGTGLAGALLSIVPGFPGLAWATEKAISTVGATVLFAIVFTILPDERVDWRDTLVGALVTAVLFNVGSVALGEYLARSTIGSVYGAAGSFAVLIVWLYYSTQVFLIGAEFTHVWAERREAAREESSQE